MILLHFLTALSTHIMATLTTMHLPVQNHPGMVEGVGLEDFETMEWVFSSSNEVAGVKWYATGYHRRIFIDMHFQQWDKKKYCNLGMMLLNNYQQALKIIDEHQQTLDLAMWHYVTYRSYGTMHKGTFATVTTDKFKYRVK